MFKNVRYFTQLLAKVLFCLGTRWLASISHTAGKQFAILHSSVLGILRCQQSAQLRVRRAAACGVFPGENTVAVWSRPGYSTAAGVWPFENKREYSVAMHTWDLHSGFLNTGAILLVINKARH